MLEKRSDVNGRIAQGIEVKGRVSVEAVTKQADGADWLLRMLSPELDQPGPHVGCERLSILTKIDRRARVVGPAAPRIVEPLS